MADEKATDLDVRNLEHYRPRSFVPQNADLTDPETVVGLLEKLLERENESAEDLEQWLLDRSEVGAALDETGSVLYIRMTCQTDDEARADAYKAFIQDVVPLVKPVDDKLDRKYLADREKFGLDEHRYEVYDRDTAA